MPVLLKGECAERFKEAGPAKTEAYAT